MRENGRGPGLAFSTVLIALSLTGCARNVGDLGRAPTGIVESKLLPAVERYTSVNDTNGLSHLPLTDEEVRMNNALWRFFASPHAREWSYTGQARLNRVELASGRAFNDQLNRYYVYLQRYGFRSSAVRYRAMADHIDADLAEIPAAFDSICAVQELDARRKRAVASFPELGPDERRQVDLRMAENRRTIAAFALALEFRYQSYSYALKRFLVEAPDEGAREVDSRLSDLAAKNTLANAGTYCSPAPGVVTVQLDAANSR